MYIKNYRICRKKGRRKPDCPSDKGEIFLSPFRLLTQAKPCNDGTVTIDVLLHEIVKKISSVTDHLEQTVSGVMVHLVNFEVLGELFYTLGKNSYLYLGGTCVSLMNGILLDYAVFCFFLDHFVSPHNLFTPQSQHQVGEDLWTKPQAIP